MKKYLLAIILLVIWPFTVWGAGAFISAPKFAVEDANGDPLSGGLVYTYECGTMTPKTTYSDRALGSANANPVVLDSRGEAGIYQSGCLKIILKDSAGTTIYTVDNFAGVGESFLQDADGDTIINVEESADEDIIRVDIGGTEQFTIQDGSIAPTTTNDIDIGTNALKIKKVHTEQIGGQPFPGFVVRPKFTYVESLDYDGGTVLFVVGDVVTGAGAATGTVVALSVGATAVTGTLYINTRNATAYVNDEAITGTGGGAAVANQASSKNAIVISPFVYYHCGTTEQLLYSDSNLAYEFTSLADGDWSYLYFDDSDIVTAATNLITAGYLVDAITEPGDYSVTKHGRYNGNDLCFFAVLATTSNAMVEFWHDGGERIFYADYILDINDQDVDLAFEDISSALTVPSFARRVNITVVSGSGDTNGNMRWRINGSSATNGTHLMFVENALLSPFQVLDVMVDSNLLFEWSYPDSTNVFDCYTNGWYFPNGM